MSVTEAKDIELPLLKENSHTSQSTEASVQDLEAKLENVILPAAQVQRPSWHRKGIYFMLMASFCSVGMGMVRKIVPSIPVSQLLFARTPFIFAVILLYFSKAQLLPELKKAFDPPMLRMASFCAVTASLYCVAAVYMPLSDLITIYSMSAIFNGILASLVLKEPYLPIEKFLGAISFFGVLLIVRPPFIFGGQDQSTPAGQTDMPRYVAAFIALGAALGSSATTVSMRSMRAQFHRFVAPFAINFVLFAAYGLYFMFIEEYRPLTLKEYGAVAVFAGFNITNIYFTAAALESETSSTAGIVSYSQLIYSLIIDLIVFGQPPAVLSLAGAAIIMGSCIYLVLMKNKQSK